MANTLYPKFKEGLLQGQFNLLTATVKAMLIKSGYVYSDTHQYVSFWQQTSSCGVPKKIRDKKWK